MSLSTTNLIFTSNSIHILPDNALVGTQGPTEATHQTSSIKVTSFLVYIFNSSFC